MADAKFPVLPSQNWWDVRKKFKQSKPTTVTPMYLSTVLSISEPAARNLIPGFKIVGLINDDGKTTERANHWRSDEDYPKVCEDIRKEVYPEELLHACPPPDIDVPAATNWFMKKTGVGAGTGAAMARFYQLVSKGDPTAGEQQATQSGKATKTPKAAQTKKATAVKATPKPAAPAELLDVQNNKNSKSPSLHIDIQVHISPSATPEQIDQIFSSMAKHLYKDAK